MTGTKRYAVAGLALVVVVMLLDAGLLVAQETQQQQEQQQGQRQDEQPSRWPMGLVMVTGMATLAVFALRIWRAETQTGIGPYDLKAVGIVLIATIVGLLVARGGDVPSSAATILGAIAGYLFGTKTPPDSSPPNPAPPA